MAYHIEEKKNIRIIGIRIPLVEDAGENMRNVPAFEFLHEFYRSSYETSFINY